MVTVNPSLPPSLSVSQSLSVSLSVSVSLSSRDTESFPVYQATVIPFLGQGLYASLNISLPIKEMGFIMVVRMLSSYE